MEISDVRFWFDNDSRNIVSSDTEIFVEDTSQSKDVTFFLVNNRESKFVLSAIVSVERDDIGGIRYFKWKILGFSSLTARMPKITLSKTELERAIPVALALLRDYNNSFGAAKQPVQEVKFLNNTLKFSAEGELL